jgi:nicotinamide mononucleotide transporter
MTDPLILFGLTTTPLELIAFVLSLITVVFNIRQLHWAWLFSIAASATYGIVFFGARLYGDMGLQVVFIAVSAWGWYQWLYGGDQHQALVVTRSSPAGWRNSIIGWLLAFGILGLFLDHMTNTDVPYPDGFLTAGSLVGQILLSRKKVENWIVWIVVDILYVGLYISKGLALTAVLYAVFVVLASLGLYTWYREAGVKKA